MTTVFTYRGYMTKNPYGEIHQYSYIHNDNSVPIQGLHDQNPYGGMHKCSYTTMLYRNYMTTRHLYTRTTVFTYRGYMKNTPYGGMHHCSYIGTWLHDINTQWQQCSQTGLHDKHPIRRHASLLIYRNMTTRHLYTMTTVFPYRGYMTKTHTGECINAHIQRCCIGTTWLHVIYTQGQQCSQTGATWKTPNTEACIIAHI